MLLQYRILLLEQSGKKSLSKKPHKWMNIKCEKYQELSTARKKEKKGRKERQSRKKAKNKNQIKIKITWYTTTPSPSDSVYFRIL